MNHNKRLQRAAEYLGATELPDGRWAYDDDGTRSYWVVESFDLEDLCDYLDSDDDYIRHDAYSHWCAGTDAEEMPEGWEPDMTEEQTEYLCLEQELRTALQHIAEPVHYDGYCWHITNYAPDSRDYDGITEPGSPWDEECTRMLDEVQETLPAGWIADWSDNDLHIEYKGSEE